MVRRLWQRHRVLRPVAFAVGSRLLTFVPMLVAAVVTNRSLGNVIDRWDTRWFVKAATAGWPAHLPMAHGHVDGSTIAFFPLFPLTLSGLSHLTGLAPVAAGALVSSAAGCTAVVALWALVRAYAGDRAADRAALLFAVFPGSFVFSLAYSDGMAITFVALSLLLMLRRRWLVAGLLGALATATAPIALALEPAALWVAAAAVVRRRELRALTAPLVVPLGFVAFQGWVWAHTGDLWAWRQTERWGWHSYPSLAYPVRLIGHLVAHPLGGTATDNLLIVGTVLTVGCAVLAVRGRTPAPVLVYGLAAAATAFVTAPVGLRPRFVLLAFPLLAALAVRLSGRAYGAAVGLSAVLLVAATLQAACSWAIFP